ncbi:cytochrome P450 [Nocardia sp. NPDC059091]|uniref:cytochrome P450 n=1 Tax=Nocardia sp. NPDC059091 TaxID=3346724 RepID=UPI00369B798D
MTDAAMLKEILSSSEVSKDPRQHWPAFRNGEIGKDFPLLNWVNTRSMFTAYGAEHRRLRKFVAPAFTDRRTAALKPRIQAIADEEEAVANYKAMIGLLHELVAYRRENPAEDMTSTLIAYADDPAKDFSVEELVGTLYLTINAGHETTVDLIDQSIYLLLTNPDHLAAALAGSLPWADVIEEALRFEPSIAHAPLRYAVRDFVLGDVTITEGDPILSCPAGANRDPKIYGDSADKFDPNRTNKDHMAFGYGAHRCPGAPLARLEAQVALPTLFQRFPHMKLAVSPCELGTVPGFIANGHNHLPVFLK